MTISCNFMNKDRWIEIQFAYLCFKLYNSLNDYVWATNYILFLADLSHVDHKKAMRLLQKVNQINAIRPTSTEFICIARQNKMTIERICKALHISKSTYIEFSHKIDMNTQYNAYSTKEELKDMELLLNHHKLLQEVGI